MQRALEESDSLTLAQSEGNPIKYERPFVERVIALCERVRTLSA